MPDYLSPFLQQLSEGTQVLSNIRQQALQQQEFEHRKAQDRQMMDMRKEDQARQNRHDSNSDITALSQMQSLARPVGADGGVDTGQTADIPVVGGAPGMQIPIRRRAKDPVSYRTADGQTKRYELLSAEELAAQRMEQLRAAEQVKMMPVIYKEQQANDRLNVTEGGKDRRLGTEQTFKSGESVKDRENRMGVAGLGAASREKAATIGADSRIKSATIHATTGNESTNQKRLSDIRSEDVAVHDAYSQVMNEAEGDRKKAKNLLNQMVLKKGGVFRQYRGRLQDMIEKNIRPLNSAELGALMLQGDGGGSEGPQDSGGGLSKGAQSYWDKVQGKK